jgi:hypothetical protein
MFFFLVKEKIARLHLDMIYMSIRESRSRVLDEFGFLCKGYYKLESLDAFKELSDRAFEVVTSYVFTGFSRKYEVDQPSICYPRTGEEPSFLFEAYNFAKAHNAPILMGTILDFMDNFGTQSHTFDDRFARGRKYMVKIAKMAQENGLLCDLRRIQKKVKRRFSQKGIDVDTEIPGFSSVSPESIRDRCFNEAAGKGTFTRMVSYRGVDSDLRIRFIGESYTREIDCHIAIAKFHCGWVRLNLSFNKKAGSEAMTRLDTMTDMSEGICLKLVESWYTGHLDISPKEAILFYPKCDFYELSPTITLQTERLIKLASKEEICQVMGEMDNVKLALLLSDKRLVKILPLEVGDILLELGNRLLESVHKKSPTSVPMKVRSLFIVERIGSAIESEESVETNKRKIECDDEIKESPLKKVKLHK